MTRSLIPKVRRAATVLGAASVLIATFAAPASAGYATLSGNDGNGASGQVTIAGLGGQATYSLKACDIKADGHHAQALLTHWTGQTAGEHPFIHETLVKATGGNDTCKTLTGTINVGNEYCEVYFNLKVMTVEGTTVLTSKTFGAKSIDAC